MVVGFPDTRAARRGQLILQTKNWHRTPRSIRAATMAIQMAARPKPHRTRSMGPSGSRTAHTPTSTIRNGVRLSPAPRSTPPRTIERPYRGSETATMRSISAARAITSGSEEKRPDKDSAQKNRNIPARSPEHSPIRPESTPYLRANTG